MPPEPSQYGMVIPEQVTKCLHEKIFEFHYNRAVIQFADNRADKTTILLKKNLSPQAVAGYHTLNQSFFFLNRRNRICLY